MRILKWFLISILIFIIIIILGITILINTRFSKDIVENIASKFLIGDFKIGSLKITPVSVHIKKVKWTKDNEDILLLESARVTFNPFKIKDLKFNGVYVKGIYMNKVDSIKSFLNLKGGGGGLIPFSISEMNISNGYIRLMNYKIDLSTDISILSDSEKMNVMIKDVSMLLNDSLPLSIKGNTSIKFANLDIIMDNLNINFKNGFLNIDGIFSNSNESDIKLKGNIDITDFSQFLPLDIKSKVILNIQLSGNVKVPKVSGSIIIKDILFKEYSLSFLEIKPELIDKDFKVMIRSNGFSCDAKGNYLERIKGKIVMNGFNIKEYTKMKTELNGSISFDVDTKGNGSFVVNFKDTKIEDLLITSLNISGKRKFMDIFIDTIHIDGDGMKFDAKGSYAKNCFDINLNSDGIILNKLHGFLKVKPEGIVKMNLKVKGDMKNPSISGILALTSFSFNNIQVDSVFVEPKVENIKSGNAEIYVNNVKIGKNEIQKLCINATLKDEFISYSFKTEFKKNIFKIYGDAILKDTISLKIDTILVKMPDKEDIRNKDVIKITIVNKDINIKDFSISAPGIQFIVNGDVGDSLDLTINLLSPDLRKVAIFLGLKQILKGDLDFYITLRGKKERPIFGFYGVLNKFQFNDIKFDSIFILVDHKDDYITLHSLKLYKDTVPSTITAKVPFEIKKGLIKNKPVIGKLNIKFEDLRPLVSNLKDINIYKGGVKIDIEGKGTIEEPDIDGNIEISGISFSVPQINLKMEDFNGNIKVKEDKVDLEISNKEKTINTSGYLLLKDFKPYDMEILTKLVNFYIKDVFYTEANLNGTITLNGSPFSPYLKGNIDILKVVANIPFGGRKKGVKPKEFPMGIDITVNMPRNVWIRNDLVDMELGGSVVVKKKERIKIEGEMNVLAGYFYYFDKPFTVEEGRFVFVEEIIPNINLKARSTLTYEEETEDKSKKNVITGPVFLEVSGTLADLQFELYTEPPLPPLGLQEIIPLLNLDMKWSDLAKFQRMSTTIPSKAVFYVIRTQLLNRIRNSLGIDALDLNANLFGAEKTTQITVGKYFTKNIYGSYTRDIFAENPDQFMLKYIMRRGNIILQRNEEGNIWGGFELNIKR